MRNFIAGLSGGSGAFAAAAVCVVLVAAGYWVQTTRNAPVATDQIALVAPSDVTPTPAVAANEEVTTTPEVATEEPSAKIEPDVEPAVVQTEAAPIPAPAFDEVRREADGMTVIAGRAIPGAEVSVLQNGVEVARSIADGSGKFATLAMIPPDGLGHVLTLLQMFDGAELASDGEIILAPLEPVVVAVADTANVPAEPEAPISVASQSQDVLQDETQPVDALTRAPTPETDQTVQETAQVAEKALEAMAKVAEAPTQIVPTPSEPEVAIADVAQVAPSEVNDDLPSAVEEVSETVIASLDPKVTETPLPPSTQDAPLSPTRPQTAEPATPEPAPVAVLKSTADGVELLNTQNPDAMTNVAIDTISYSDVGEVELAGRAQSKATSVRVYLDNNSVIILPVDAGGRWRGELPDVDEGIYTLRVDEVAADGQVTSRVETPFKREAAEVLAAASAAQEGPIKAITVQKGATLWAIARERYGDGELYVRVFEANAEAIRNPDLIYPGQIFDLPD